MNGWIIFGICMTILFILSASRLFFVYWDVKKMTQQLEGVNEHFGTNELVRTNTHHKRLSQFANEINQLIRLYKENELYLEKRERQLKEEITNISHDLRTPLTSIKGFTQLLIDEDLPIVEKEKYMSIIQGKIDALTTQVDSFYELSSINSLDYKLVMEHLLLNEIIEEYILIFYQDFQEKELEVIVEPLKEMPVLASEEAVQRMMINIIQNVLRYAKSYVQITLLEEEKFIRLCVVNDTNDITEDDVAHIFNRTYRKDMSRADGRLGLGLHIVQQLIQKQGGRITADIQGDQFTLDILFYKRK